MKKNRIKKMSKNMKTLIIILIVMLVLCFIYYYGKSSTEKILNNIEYHLKYVENKNRLYQLRNNKIFEISSQIKGEEKFVKKGQLFGINSGYIHVNELDKVKLEIFINGFCYKKNYDEKNINVGFGSCFKRINNFELVNSSQAFVVPKTGYYNIELWGSRGGNSSFFTENKLLDEKHGKGAYVSGNIKLSKGEILYIYVGGAGEDGKIIEDVNRFTTFGYPSKGGIGGYNGGGNGYDDPEVSAGGGGGGATDIRLVPGLWNAFNSLKSRIMVAAGGGGMSRYYYYTKSNYAGIGESGSGGTLNGEDGYFEISNDDFFGYGATQTGGYKFGIGENGIMCMTTINGLGGGAGGYYGSRTGMCNPESWQPSNGAGGGSSFVSGCKGCNAISEKSTESKIIHTNQNIHYSNKKFDDIKMLSGDDKIPTPYSGKQTIGNDGDGYARITFLHY